MVASPDISPADAAPGRPRRLVIVESPAKARTIAGYLGSDYVVESSIGHIRDLPNRASDMPAEAKHLWATYAIDVEHGFAPVYVVNPDKKQQVAKLRQAMKGADELLLATDEDREGEAIAWHLLEVLKPRIPVRRMVFHEITPQAIADAVDHPREINRSLVEAQETRRIVDRLVGYGLSPVLWKKVMPGLSAGRVQSVATRLLVERERARMRHVSASYWDLQGAFAVRGEPAVPGDPKEFTATLVSLDGVRVATGRDFGEDGTLTARDGTVVQLDEAAATGLAAGLEQAEFAVTSVEERPYRRSPYPPFITSTLQQEGSRKLRLSARLVMSLAQRLYEAGYITYMRTDSTTLSDTALSAARDQARELYGAEYVPDAPRRHERKVKNAQEAHEAIRPAGDRFRTPREVRGELGTDEWRLYELIWQRTVASQMADAVGRSVSVRVAGAGADGRVAEFGASGKVVTFPGFLRAYVEDTDDETADREDRERRLPQVQRDQPLDAAGIEPQPHATTPPARYTEASLVKALEELGIGRPSTYASILSTIQDRGYVFKRGTALVPSFTAFAVVGLLEQYFARLVDYGFTAALEDDLDAIAGGERASTDWLTSFYFGVPSDGKDPADDAALDTAGLQRLVSDRLGEIDAREVNSIPIGVAEDGEPVVVRVGRYGPYVAKGEARASVPEDLPPDELTIDAAMNLLTKTSDERVLGNHPHTGEPVLVRSGRYGPYVTTQPLDGGEVRTASLFSTMSPESVTMTEAVRLLSLPRTLGVDPGNGEPVTAQNGRYGPYVKRGADSRSIGSEEELFTVTLDDALALFAQPKTRGRQAAAAPLRELGNDPSSDRPVVVKEGRFGPYVTDGETNASLRKTDAVETVTIERAAELLAERRAKEADGSVGRKRTARKTTARKTTAGKTAARKTTAKKSAAKKTT